jgi:phosphonate transport system substrate-binding protein
VDSEKNASRAGLVVVLAVVAAVAAWAFYATANLERDAQEQGYARMMSTFLTGLDPIVALDAVYKDVDGDLLADAPENEALLNSPEELAFSFITSSDSTNKAEQWQQLMDAIKEKTGLPVSYLRITDGREQLEALRCGKLHITAFSTGEVPAAVNTAGYVPVCTFGQEDGSSGYKMEFIVKADSKIKKLSDLRGKKIAFTRPNSNSGCKAPAMLLMEEAKLQPERDYQWSYTYGHDGSVAAVLAGDVDAAPIASDAFARMIARGEAKKEDFRTIYESEQFPPAAFGFAYNLDPKIKEAIQAALVEFKWDGTKIAESFGADGSTKFVPVSYKDDWSNIRRVDLAASNARSLVAN